MSAGDAVGKRRRWSGQDPHSARVPASPPTTAHAPPPRAPSAAGPPQPPPAPATYAAVVGTPHRGSGRWTPGLKHLRETKKEAYGRLHYGPLRCSDVPLYDSVVDSHAHGLSFPPTLVVLGALMLKRWIVQQRICSISPLSTEFARPRLGPLLQNTEYWKLAAKRPGYWQDTGN
jgi:hypothetical protein